MLVGAVLVIVGMFARLAGSVFMPGSVARSMAARVMKLVRLMAFAGAKENQGERRGKDGGFAEKGSHSRHSRHSL